MKKILTSVIAAAALLFGMTSCNGVLHDGIDAVPETLYIIGGATTGGWAGADNQKMTKNGTAFSIDIELSAGEFKFVTNNPIAMNNWTNVKMQYGSNGAGSDQKSWKNETPGKYTVTYDLATESLSTISFSTKLDDTFKVKTNVYLYGGIGTVKLEKQADKPKLYKGLWQGAKGNWGEDAGFIRCALVVCTEENIESMDWNKIVVRYGSGKDDPQNETKDPAMSTGGYTGLKEGYYATCDGTAYSGLVDGGNFVIKGVEVGTWYEITVDMTSGSPVLSIAKTDKRPAPVVLKTAAQFQGTIGAFDLEWKDGVAVVEKTLDANYKDGWNNDFDRTMSFALLTEKDNWDADCYKGTIFMVDNEASLSIGGSSNNIVTFKSDVSSKTVKFTFTGTEKGINVKVEVK
mgnify:FL=1